jgi:hypothetical protein
VRKSQNSVWHRKFWNEAGQILPSFLLIECFCNVEKAGRMGTEETTHPQDNHKETTSFIPKCTQQAEHPVLLFPKNANLQGIDGRS